MADRTLNNTDYKWKPRATGKAFPITDAITIGLGALVQLEAGYLNHWDETGGFQGILINGDSRLDDGVIVGNTTDTPPPEGRVDVSGATIYGLTIAGTPTQAKVGDLVYSADSDLASVTFTDTTNPPIGWCSRYTSATDQDLTLFTPEEHAAGIADATWNT